MKARARIGPAIALLGPSNLMAIGPKLGLQFTKSLVRYGPVTTIFSGGPKRFRTASMVQALIYWFPGNAILSVTSVVSRRSECIGKQAITPQCPPRYAHFFFVGSFLVNANTRKAKT